MFETNDDCLDVDDEFLNKVFESEQSHFSSGFQNKDTLNTTLEPQRSVRCIEQSFSRPASSNFEIFSVCGPNFEGRKPKPTPTKLLIYPDQEDKEENLGTKRKQTSPSRPKNSKRERKFPGPAGLLPDRKSCGFTPLKLDSLLEADKSLSSPTSEDLCSQGHCSGSILDEEPWQNFLSDLGPDKSILNEVNVASVKRKAAAKCFVGRKVPFLAAVLHHLDVSSPDPCIILRDSTGEIHGTLHREVWEQFAGELVVGSVLVIRNVGLLSTGISSRRHYLNITANNLVTIYSAHSDKPKDVWLQDLAESIHKWRSLVSPSFGVGSPTSVGSPGLYNSTVCSPFINSSVSSPNIPTKTISKRETEVGVNKKLQINVKTAQGLNLSSINSNPGSLVKNAAMGKNLIHSFLPKSLSNSFKNNNNENASNNVSKSVPNQNKMLNKVSVEFTKKRSSFVSSNLVQPPVSPWLKNSTEGTLSTNPVILEPKKFCCESFPQSNSERQVRNGKVSQTNTCVEKHKTNSKTVNTNPKLVLSQSTQLTTEEQSLVESVFDGVDADSLFDDDF